MLKIFMCYIYLTFYCVNPLYTYGFFLLAWYNKHGIVHYTSSIMLHFIWVFTVCTSTRLGVSLIQRDNLYHASYKQTGKQCGSWSDHCNVVANLFFENVAGSLLKVLVKCIWIQINKILERKLVNIFISTSILTFVLGAQKNHLTETFFLMLCLCLTSHQQQRSYGDGATAKSLIWQTGEAGNRTCDPWFTRQAVYPLHHSGSYSSFESPQHTFWLSNKKYIFYNTL